MAEFLSPRDGRHLRDNDVVAMEGRGHGGGMTATKACGTSRSIIAGSVRLACQAW